MTDELALEIARCAYVDEARRYMHHPCRAIVSVQAGIGDPQVPEPWRGSLSSAEILFISSNPSINEEDDSPRVSASNESILHYYQEGGISHHFPFAANAHGEKIRGYVRFWAAVRARSREILGKKDVQAGADFAITEVVHCKSKGEHGVSDALATCRDRFMTKILRESRAGAIVLLGGQASSILDLVRTCSCASIVMLPHPNAREDRSVEAVHSREGLSRLQRAMKLQRTERVELLRPVSSKSIAGSHMSA